LEGKKRLEIIMDEEEEIVEFRQIGVI